MAPVSPLQWEPNSDRPYASTNHSSRLRSSRSLFVSASRNGSEAVGRWGLTWSGILFLHLKIKPNQQTHRYWHFFFQRNGWRVYNHFSEHFIGTLRGFNHRIFWGGNQWLALARWRERGLRWASRASDVPASEIAEVEGLKWEKQASGRNIKYNFVDVAHVLKKVSIFKLLCFRLKAISCRKIVCTSSQASTFTVSPLTNLAPLLTGVCFPPPPWSRGNVCVLLEIYIYFVRLQMYSFLRCV